MYIETLIKNQAVNRFTGSSFQEEIITKKADIIKGVVIFSKCSFKHLRLYGHVFEKEVIFENCSFEGLSLTSVSFKSEVIISQCIFKQLLKIDSCLFLEKVHFSKNKYFRGVNFFDAGSDSLGPIEFKKGFIIE